MLPTTILVFFVFLREGTSYHKITSPRELSSNDTASDSEHLDALREDGTKLNVAILDALGFDQVECTKDSEDGNRSFERRVGVIAVSQEKALQRKMVELQPGPTREVSPEFRTNGIVLNLIQTSALMAEPAAI